VDDAAFLPEKKDCVKLTFTNGYSQICSHNHYWFSITDCDYVRACDLHINDQLFHHSYDGNKNLVETTVKISNIEFLQEKRTVADITVRNNHNFLVHLGDGNFVLSKNCHNLSATAKQNLLKPLEEPPKHVLWALCTTDPEKLPKAALNRCIKLYFEYPGLLDASKRIWKIAKKEFPDTTNAILKPFIKKIAMNTSGQMRDSLSVLESLASIIEADKNITEEELQNEFRNVLTSMGELTTPAIRYITFALFH